MRCVCGGLPLNNEKSRREGAVSGQDDAYISALRYSWLTPFYDTVVRWTTREATFKRALVNQVDVRPKQRLLDLGCGTATLTIDLKVACPDADITGLDGDAGILQTARKKALDAGVTVVLEQGCSYALPYADNSFDRVVSSLFFHHLTTGNKRRTLAEIKRVLTPGGELHVADWGAAQNVIMRSLFFLVQLHDGFETTADNVQGRLPTLIGEAGFEDVRKTAEWATPLGTIALLRAANSDSPERGTPS